METKIRDFMHTTKFTKILIGVGCLIIALIIFQAGMAVGLRKASFSYGMGNVYFRQTFGEPKGGPRMMIGGFFGEDFASGHGAAGRIIKINLPNVVVLGPDNIEKTVTIKDDTQIVRFREKITAADLKTDDNIVVIGVPNSSSQVEAKLVRVMPEPPMNYPTTTKQ
jgi:hypothetical protein